MFTNISFKLQSRYKENERQTYNKNQYRITLRRTGAPAHSRGKLDGAGNGDILPLSALWAMVTPSTPGLRTTSVCACVREVCSLQLTTQSTAGSEILCYRATVRSGTYAPKERRRLSTRLARKHAYTTVPKRQRGTIQCDAPEPRDMLLSGKRVLLNTKNNSGKTSRSLAT